MEAINGHLDYLLIHQLMASMVLINGFMGLSPWKTLIDMFVLASCSLEPSGYLQGEAGLLGPLGQAEVWGGGCHAQPVKLAAQPLVSLQNLPAAASISVDPF